MSFQRQVPPGTAGNSSSRRRITGLLAGTTTLALVGLGTSVVMAANPPVGPGNIEIFTKRDMVAIEGYSAQAGQDATIRVNRGGELIGVARGVVDATGFLEVNHPGGVCWDMVTPNITGGDEVTVEFEDNSGDGALAGTAVITSVDAVDGTATPEITGDVEGQVVVKGKYGADVDTTRMAVEIVNPAMRDMGIGERAIGWPDDEQPAGYTVEGNAANGEFTVTYGFFSKAERDAAYAGDPSVASWQAEPPNVEAQLGLTISEFKEIDGPGFGGCPAGPSGQAPNQPTEAFASAAGSNSITATWSPATVPADAPPITGYEVIAEDTVLGQEVSIKVGSEATTATIRGLSDGQAYPVKVVAMNGQASSPAAAGTVTVTSDEQAPTASAPGAPGSVAVKDGSLLGTADVSWTAAAAKGSAVSGYTVQALSGTTEVAKADAGSGATTARVEGLTPGTGYNFVVTAKSTAGNTAAEPVPFTVQAGDETPPSAPNVVRVTTGNGSATVEWQGATAGNTPVTGYILTATPPDPGTAVEVKTDAAGRSAVLNGLTNGTTYTLNLVATSTAGESAPATFGTGASKTVTPADQLTATAQYRADKQEWRITGSASITTGNTIRATNANGQIGDAVTVAADGSWTIRARNSGVRVTPTITVTSSQGGSVEVPVSTR